MHTKFSSYYLNPVALCAYAGLLLAAYFLGLPYLPTCLLLLAGVAFLAWIFNHRRKLAISEIPVSTIASAAQGYIELLGQAQSLLPLKSPLRHVDCVWFRHWVYAKDHGGIWRLADYNASHNKFGLQDATGYCEVNPEGAEIIATERHTIIRNDHKYIEDVLRVGKRLYVLGELDARNDINAPAQIRKEVRELMTEWKANPIKTMLRFDLNRDGILDMHEWEYARQHAHEEVETRHKMLAKNTVHCITKPKNDRLFLISGIAPEELRANYHFWASLHLLCLAAAVVALAALAVKGYV